MVEIRNQSIGEVGIINRRNFSKGLSQVGSVENGVYVSNELFIATRYTIQTLRQRSRAEKIRTYSSESGLSVLTIAVQLQIPSNLI